MQNKRRGFGMRDFYGRSMAPSPSMPSAAERRKLDRQSPYPRTPGKRLHLPHANTRQATPQPPRKLLAGDPHAPSNERSASPSLRNRPRCPRGFPNWISELPVQIFSVMRVFGCNPYGEEPSSMLLPEKSLRFPSSREIQEASRSAVIRQNPHGTHSNAKICTENRFFSSGQGVGSSEAFFRTEERASPGACDDGIRQS